MHNHKKAYFWAKMADIVKEKEIAEKFLIEREGEPLFHHLDYYREFALKKLIPSALIRSQNTRESDQPRKKLCSFNENSSSPGTQAHLSPDLCIVCWKELKWIQRKEIECDRETN